MAGVGLIILLLYCYTLFSIPAIMARKKYTCKLPDDLPEGLTSCCSLTDDGVRYYDCYRKAKGLFKEEQIQAGSVEYLACIEKCYFEDNRFFLDDKNPRAGFDMSSIRNHARELQTNHTQAAEKWLMDGYKWCQRKVAESRPDDNDTLICDNYAMQIAMCLRIRGARICPNEFYQNSALCTKTRDYVKHCI